MRARQSQRVEFKAVARRFCVQSCEVEKSQIALEEITNQPCSFLWDSKAMKW